MENNLYICYCGIGSPSSENWHLNHEIEMQRLYYILGGQGGYYGSNGQLHMFREGYLYLFPYNLRQQFVSQIADPIRHLYFDFLSTPPVIAAEPISLCVSDHPELKCALELAGEIMQTRPKSTLLASKLCKDMLSFLLSLIGEAVPLPFHTDDIICRSLETIQNSYDKPITVRELAAQAGFEENYFIRRFRSIMHQTPYAYLRNYRLMQARNLLRAGMSMDEIASKVGYASSASLARALRQTKTQ